jgi:hypothetical protein
MTTFTTQDRIDAEKKLVDEAPFQPGYEDTVEKTMVKTLEPIPFAGMVDTGDDNVSK